MALENMIVGQSDLMFFTLVPVNCI